jgi:hypothetical protein
LNSFYSGEYFNLDEASRPEPSYPDAATVNKVRLPAGSLAHQGNEVDGWT